MSRSFTLTALAATLLAFPALAQDVTPKYFNVPGTDTKLKIYGFVQAFATESLNVAVGENGGLTDNFTSQNYFDTPTGQFYISARTSRFGFATITPTNSFGDVTTKIEVDFANANENKALGYDNYNLYELRIRHAVINIGGWTIGYTWTNWLDLDAGAETVDWAGPIGQTGADTGRYAQVRYTIPFTKQCNLAISAEDNIFDYTAGPGSYASGRGFYYGDVIGANSANAVPSVKYPTFVAALTYADSWGHLGLRALEQYGAAYTPATLAGANGALVTAGSTTFGAWNGAGQISGDVKFGKDDLVFQVYYGKGLGSYGLDVDDMVWNTDNNSTAATKSLGWQVGYTHTWDDQWRSNIFASGINYSDDALESMGYTNDTSSTGYAGDMHKGGYYGVNAIWKVSKTVELGAEYTYEWIQSYGPAVVQQDGSMGNKIHNSMVQLCMTATF